MALVYFFNERVLTSVRRFDCQAEKFFAKKQARIYPSTCSNPPDDHDRGVIRSFDVGAVVFGSASPALTTVRMTTTQRVIIGAFRGGQTALAGK